MDSCFIDITVEFFAVAFHNILHYSSVYPKSVFTTRRKYGVALNYCIHPEVNQYIDLCLKTILEFLKLDQLRRIEFAITNNAHKPLLKYIFDLEKKDYFDETTDAYLVQTEQNMRAFCLNLQTLTDNIKSFPEDLSFLIFLHTTESTAVAVAGNPNLEDFPLIEIQDKMSNFNKIIPLRRFTVRNYNLDSYIEIQ